MKPIVLKFVILADQTLAIRKLVNDGETTQSYEKCFWFGLKILRQTLGSFFPHASASCEVKKLYHESMSKVESNI